MESNFTRYIWKHTHREQLWILLVVLMSMVPYYLAFDLPKMLINGPIAGGGFESVDSVQPFLPGTPFAGLELDRIQMLLALSLIFLALVIINGLFKYYINTYKGLLGERLLRRVRYDLIDRILRFLPYEFKRVKGAEISSMVKDEVEPLGGFTAEAFVQPMMLGGQALTALAFIFVQNIWLGVLALFMASVQMLIIPRLRQRLLVLGRERQINARRLAGKVTEIVDGIETIHASDTSNYERADIVSRLGTLFRIRYEIYTKKYKIKFLNNFLAQVTPFLFYLLGGYLAITGRLDVGQLVAVITAYKELPGPLKQLIDWDLSRQDVQVKYEQIVEQFDVDEIIHPDMQLIDSAYAGVAVSPLSASNITMADEGGSATLENVSLTMEAGQSVAIVGDAYSGANILAEAFAGVARPVKGKILAGKANLIDLPESVTGRKISYASSDTVFFSGSVGDNLLYGLKNQPLNEVAYKDDDVLRREWELAEAKRTGNPIFDLNSNWIDNNLVNGMTEPQVLVEAMQQVLRVAQLSDDIFDFALYSTIDLESDSAFPDQIVTLRKSIRESLEKQDLGDLVIPFDIDRYNLQAKLLDNILFGVLKYNPATTTDHAGAAYLDSILSRTGLDEQLFHMGRAIAENTRDLFQGLPEDHPFYDRMELADADDIPKFRALYERTNDVPFNDVSIEDRKSWIYLTFHYVEPQYRFGLLDDALMQNIVETRKLLHENMPKELGERIDIYDADRYLPSANLVDNIVFGKIDMRFKGVIQQIRDTVAPLLSQQPDLYLKMYSVGLNYDVGPAGRRLSLAQRQKLNFARALMRKSEYYVFNRPLAGLDQSQQAQIIENTLTFLSQQGNQSGVVWVLASEPNAKYFDRRITFNDKKVVEDKLLNPNA